MSLDLTRAGKPGIAQTMASANTQVGEEVLVRPPGHPVPSLQGPFEESMAESVKEDTEFRCPH